MASKRASRAPDCRPLATDRTEATQRPQWLPSCWIRRCWFLSQQLGGERASQPAGWCGRKRSGERIHLRRQESLICHHASPPTGSLALSLMVAGWPAKLASATSPQWTPPCAFHHHHHRRSPVRQSASRPLARQHRQAAHNANPLASRLARLELPLELCAPAGGCERVEFTLAKWK